MVRAPTRPSIRCSWRRRLPRFFSGTANASAVDRRLAVAGSTVVVSLCGWPSVCLAMPTVGARFTRACGLRADNQDTSEQTQTPLNLQRSYTLREVRGNIVFWLYAMGLSVHAMFGTAVTFHIVAIFAEAGRSREAAFAYFIPHAMVSVATSLSASTLADYIRLKPLLLVMLAGFMLGAVGLVFLHYQLGYWSLVLGFGVGGGLWGTLANLVFIRHYGPKHLGEISGLNSTLTVFASAIGPVLFSVAYDITGTFTTGPMLSIVILLVLFVASVLVKQPLDNIPQRR